MKKYYLILVLVCAAFSSFAEGTGKSKSAIIDISKIKIKISVHDFSLSLLISYIENIANSNLPKNSKSIKFWIQVEGKPKEDRLYWKDSKLYNQKNEVFDIESKNIYSKVLTESFDFEFKSVPLDKFLTFICKMYYLKYTQDGYNILLIIPQDWSKKMNDDEDEDIESDWKNASIKSVYFNQALLRECTSYLSKISGVKIDLSERLNKKNDLAVDLHLDTSKEYHLKDVLFMIIGFIEKKHGIKIKIEPVSNNHIVLDLNLPQGEK